MVQNSVLLGLNYCFVTASEEENEALLKDISSVAVRGRSVLLGTSV